MSLRSGVSGMTTVWGPLTSTSFPFLLMNQTVSRANFRVPCLAGPRHVGSPGQEQRLCRTRSPERQRQGEWRVGGRGNGCSYGNLIAPAAPRTGGSQRVPIRVTLGVSVFSGTPGRRPQTWTPRGRTNPLLLPRAEECPAAGRTQDRTGQVPRRCSVCPRRSRGSKGSSAHDDTEQEEMTWN